MRQRGSVAVTRGAHNPESGLSSILPLATLQIRKKR